MESYLAIRKELFGLIGYGRTSFASTEALFHSDETTGNQWVDWAAADGVVCLLYDRLKKNDELENLPSELVDRMEGYYYGTVAANVRLLHHLYPILDYVQKQGLSTIILQGVSHISHLYKNIGLRPMSDIDLWVAPRNRQILRTFLLESGYETDAFYPNTFKKGSTVLDVHTDLFGGDRFTSRKYLVSESTHTIYKRCRQIQVGDRIALALDPYDQMVYLILHAMKHGANRLIWFFDILLMAETWHTSDWEIFRSRMTRYGTLTSSHTIFHLMTLISDWRPPKTLLDLNHTRLGPLENLAIRHWIRQGRLPDWAAEWIPYRKKSIPVQIRHLFEVLFPKPEVIRQSYQYSSGMSANFLSMYIRRMIELTKRCLKLS